mmetsp:Transcript_953/g.1835  ORF Transcript_953/g.1835 Transcript_953/m.1835 type:complete len:215 (+) Transcript_953:2341-2985(+)
MVCVGFALLKDVHEHSTNLFQCNASLKTTADVVMSTAQLIIHLHEFGKRKRVGTVVLAFADRRHKQLEQTNATLRMIRFVIVLLLLLTVIVFVTAVNSCICSRVWIHTHKQQAFEWIAVKHVSRQCIPFHILNVFERNIQNTKRILCRRRCYRLKLQRLQLRARQFTALFRLTLKTSGKTSLRHDSLGSIPQRVNVERGDRFGFLMLCLLERSH